jgi:hypothetical protein
LPSIRKAQEILADIKRDESIQSILAKDTKVTLAPSVEGTAGTAEVKVISSAIQSEPEPQVAPKQFTMTLSLRPDAYNELKEVAALRNVPLEEMGSIALSCGLIAIKRRHLETAVHEAGHAVMFFMVAEELGHDPAEAVQRIKITAGYEGAVWGGDDLYPKLTPDQHKMVKVAGCVAEAKWADKPFDKVWEDYGPGGDRKNFRLMFRVSGRTFLPNAVVKEAANEVAQTVRAKFDEPRVWYALCKLAGRLIVGKMSGWAAWQIYSGALAEYDVGAKS